MNEGPDRMLGLQPQMGFEEMWGFNRQTIALWQIASDQVILNLSQDLEEVGRNPGLRLAPGRLVGHRASEKVKENLRNGLTVQWIISR